MPFYRGKLKHGYIPATTCRGISETSQVGGHLVVMLRRDEEDTLISYGHLVDYDSTEWCGRGVSDEE